MDQPKVSVIYHGATGGIQAVAWEVAAGAEEAGAVVRVRRVPEHPVSVEGGGSVVTIDDLHWADAVVLGSPSRYGTLAAPLRSYVESWATAAGERPKEIVWSGFAAGDGVLRGGHEATLMTLFRTLLHLGGVLVPTPRAQDLDVPALARRTGRDVARVARRLLAGAAAEGEQVPTLA